LVFMGNQNKWVILIASYWNKILNRKTNPFRCIVNTTNILPP
jgi:hypothetical protein